MEILVISKTHKGKSACVGGILLKSYESVRLLNPGNWDQYGDTELNVGDIWDVDFDRRMDLTPPHIEDIIIKGKKFLRKEPNLPEFITKHKIKVYHGSPNEILGDCLKWSHDGSGYLHDKNNVPSNSVGFWVSDKDLTYDGKYYVYPKTGLFIPSRRLPYVGYQKAIETINAGTIIRYSLARWWKPKDASPDTIEKCFLQLSGWYEKPTVN